MKTKTKRLSQKLTIVLLAIVAAVAFSVALSVGLVQIGHAEENGYKVGETSCATFGEAVTAAKAEGGLNAITVVGTVSEDELITVKDEVTITLADGAVWTVNGGLNITTDGVTVTGSQADDALKNGQIVGSVNLMSNSTLKDLSVQGSVTVSAHEPVLSNVSINGADAPYALSVNGGSLAISDGSFSGNIVVTNSDLTISGGTFTEDVTKYLQGGLKLEREGDEGPYKVVVGASANATAWYTAQTTDETPNEVEVTSPDEWLYVANLANDTDVAVRKDFADITVKIVKDLDFTGYTCVPAGTQTNPFKGSVEGAVVDGKTVVLSNIEMTQKLAGLIGSADVNANITVSNLTIKDSIFHGNNGSLDGQVTHDWVGVGAVAGEGKLKIDNVTVSGVTLDTVYEGTRYNGGQAYMGGLLGHTDSPVVMENVDVNDLHVFSAGRNAAGLVGFVGASTLSVKNANISDLELEGGMSYTGAIGGYLGSVTTATYENITVDVPNYPFCGQQQLTSLTHVFKGNKININAKSIMYSQNNVYIKLVDVAPAEGEASSFKLTFKERMTVDVNTDEAGGVSLASRLDDDMYIYELTTDAAQIYRDGEFVAGTKSLDDALNYEGLQSGDIIYYNNDLTQDIEYNREGIDVTLDITGHNFSTKGVTRTINVTAGNLTICNNAGTLQLIVNYTLILNGGNLINVYNQSNQNSSGGMLNVNKGHIDKLEQGFYGQTTVRGGEIDYLINGGSTLSVLGGTIHRLNNLFGTISINGGLIDQSIELADNGEYALSMGRGTITAEFRDAWDSDNKLDFDSCSFNVTGGTFADKGFIEKVILAKCVNKGKVVTKATVDDVELHTLKYATDLVDGDKAYAGSSDTEIDEKYIADGYAVMNIDGVWTITTMDKYIEAELTELAAYRDDLIATGAYSEAGEAQLNAIYTATETNLNNNAASLSMADIRNAITAAKAEMDGVMTETQEQDAVAARKSSAALELKIYAASKGISPTDATVTDGIEAIEAATDLAGVQSAFETAKAAIDAKKAAADAVVALNEAKAKAKNDVILYAAQKGIPSTDDTVVTALGEIEKADSVEAIEGLVADAQTAIDAKKAAADEAAALAQAKSDAKNDLMLYAASNGVSLADENVVKALNDIDSAETAEQANAALDAGKKAVDEAKAAADKEAEDQAAANALKAKKDQAKDDLRLYAMSKGVSLTDKSVTNGLTAIDSAADEASLDVAVSNAETAIDNAAKAAAEENNKEGGLSVTAIVVIVIAIVILVLVIISLIVAIKAFKKGGKDKDEE